MSYFNHQQPRQPYQQTFRQQSDPPYPVDEDGDRIYTEEDYAVPADGDAFLPDEEDADALYADPFAAQQPFSYMGAYDTLNDAPEEEWNDGEDDEPDGSYEDLLTDEERAELSRSNWRLLAGLADFGGVILGTAAILVLIALLVSLMNWLINDISQTFILLQTQL